MSKKKLLSKLIDKSYEVRKSLNSRSVDLLFGSTPKYNNTFNKMTSRIRKSEKALSDPKNLKGKLTKAKKTLSAARKLLLKKGNVTAQAGLVRKTGKIKFVRIRGRIVPIRAKKK